MNEEITWQAQSRIRSAARLLQMLTGLVTSCRRAGARAPRRASRRRVEASLRPAEETVISRSTGGRC
ncbi:MAG: hypothetical protein QOH66_2755 [Actinomycetota bacterium]|nr:hypothetical protein [Actinomycetota bacterium]